MIRTNKLTVHREKEGVIHCDGDPIKAEKDLEFELIHHGIKMVTNPNAEPNNKPFPERHELCRRTSNPQPHFCREEQPY
ncbi:MAG: hypothetical protein V8Q65_06170 [Bacteroidaceae bacterium]